LSGFVELINSPDEAAVDIAPAAEILKVNVADGENLGGVAQIGTDGWDRFRPAPIGRAQKRKRCFAHLIVLAREVGFDNVAVKLGAQPRLVLGVRLTDVFERRRTPYWMMGGTPLVCARG